MRRRIFEATRPDGQTVRRSTERNGKVYTHAVVIWHPAYPPKFDLPAQAAGWVRSAEWASRLDLAEANARRWNGKPGYRAEVLEAREVLK